MKYILSSLKIVIASLLCMVVIAIPVAAAPTSGIGPANPSKQALCEGAGGTWNGTTCANAAKGDVLATFRSISNILLFVLGAVAVIMVIIGGIRYVTSNGDQNAVTSAKNTVMYAIIGVIVAIAAYAIVHFVTLNIK